MTEIFAPAKVNLTLHVTGQRDDGYHLLDSLVCFPNVGDRLTFAPADEMSLNIHGAPDLPCDDTNLILRAAKQFMPKRPHHIELYKSLPVSSGIGGGSANAAATIRFTLGTGSLVPEQRLINDSARLGADVPVCIASTPQRFQGIGDVLTPVSIWPDQAFILLVNPRVPVSTPSVFKSLNSKNNAPMPADLPDFKTVETLVDFIATQRNDLQDAAIAQQPVISHVIDMIKATPDCLFARMSGSGATCFGMYRTHEEVSKAAAEIGSNHSDWWVEYGALQHR